VAIHKLDAAAASHFINDTGGAMQRLKGRVPLD